MRTRPTMPMTASPGLPLEQSWAPLVLSTCFLCPASWTFATILPDPNLMHFIHQHDSDSSTVLLQDPAGTEPGYLVRAEGSWVNACLCLLNALKKHSQVLLQMAGNSTQCTRLPPNKHPVLSTQIYVKHSWPSVKAQQASTGWFSVDSLGFRLVIKREDNK